MSTTKKPTTEIKVAFFNNHAKGKFIVIKLTHSANGFCVTEWDETGKKTVLKTSESIAVAMEHYRETVSEWFGDGFVLYAEM